MVLKLPYLVQVCYEKNWQEIPNIKEISQQVGKLLSGYLLIDHSKQAQQLPSGCPITYLHRPENPGLASAYNTALQMMGEATWLIILDHDTTITETYLQEINQKISQVPTDCVALAARVYENQRQISPIAADQYINRYFKALSTGIYSQKVMAINSGTVVKKSFLEKLGGFNLQFPLDFLDHWLFFEIYQHQKKVCVLSSQLQHELSVLHYDQMKVQRYQSILQAEKLYYQEYETDKQRIHARQLCKRACKQFLLVKNRKIWKMTVKAYFEWKKGKQR